MKKVLALILTAAMLLSCMIVGISAVREHATNVETTVTTDKAATNAAHFSGLRYNDPYYTDDYTFSITMKSCTADFGDMAENTGFCAGVPIINMKANTIGWNDGPSLSYTFADNTWYKIDYVVDGDTTIYVNGAEVGTLDGAMPGNFYGSFYNSYVTEIYYKSGDNYALYEDFEDGSDPVFSTDVTTFEDVQTNVSYENYNVTYSEFGAATNAAHFSGLRYNDPYYTDNYKFTITMKSCTADFGEMAENTGFCDGVPIINMKANTIGWNNGPSLSYTFEDDTWYTIQYVVAGDTTIKVNGETVGTLDGAMPGNFYGSFYNSYVRFVGYSDGNDYALYEDFTDGVDNVFSTDLTYFKEVGEKYDLGMKYYYWDYDTVAYHENLNFKNGALWKYAFDFCIDEAGGGFINDFFGGGVVLTDSKISNDGAEIALDLDLNKWYHIEIIDDGAVEVYLDGAYIGNLGNTIAANGICGHASHIAIDNLNLNDVVDDFEDGEYNAWSTGTAGLALNYEFEEVMPDTIFDKIGDIAAEGDAYLIENNWDSESGGYVELGSAYGNLGDNYIVDFNLALLPTNNHADGNFFEIWTNWANGSSPIRWKVGTAFAGKDDDLVQYDWGETGLDNFHRVTIEFKNNRGYLYIDEAEIYNGLCGTYKDLSMMIVMNWNANAVIDNFRIIDGESYEQIAGEGNLPTGTGYNRGNNVIKWVDVDAADFCDENGCMTGKTVMDYDSTCYSLGQYTTNCAVCGDVKDTHEIALKDHTWAGYDMNRTTDTGLVYTYCKNSGCVETRYTSLPKNYTGTLYQFFDMQDDFVLVFGDDTPTSASGLDGYVIDSDTNEAVQSWKVTEDGKLEFLGHCVYDEFWGIENAKMPVNDWSISYDFFLDESKHWTNEDGGVDSECFFIRCCGAAGYQLQVGWDRNTEELFIRKTDGSKVLATLPYEFEDLTTYNFKVACKYEGCDYTHTHTEEELEDPDFWCDRWYAEIAIYVNGEKVLAYGDTTGADQYSIYDIAYGADLGAYHKFPTFGQFGTSYTIDNLAFGSYDFEIVPVAGDIDGDGELSAADATMMRQYLAGIITLEDFADASVADVNGDGVVNAKDQLAIRIALAA